MESNYWARFTENRISRRHALVAGGSMAAAAAFLAACGGGDDKTPSRKSSALLINPTDQTSTRTRGGTLNVASNVATATLDQSRAGNGQGTVLSMSTYSQLMRMKMGTFPKIPEQIPEPEFAGAVEMSGDGLTVTFKLRGMKFDDRAPTNGRVSTSEDVKYSWERWESTNVRAPDLSNKKHADAPVTRVTTPDKQTVVFHLAFPFAPFLSYLTAQWFPFIYPMEAEGGFDTRAIARGTGPWLLPDVRPKGDAEMSRNPNYYHAGEPYFDKLHIHSITDYSTILAQFEAGNLDIHLGSTGVPTFTQEDVLSIKKKNPAMLMYQRPFYAKGCGGIFFSSRPNSPWNDERVRRALAMNMDAALWGDNASNRKRFEAEGLPVDVKWFAAAGPGYSWYLDPEKNELGKVSSNLHYNPKEAHKLLEATGLKLPIRSLWNVQVASNDLNDSMMNIYQESGDFKFDVNVIPDSNRYVDTIRNVGGDFDGHGISLYVDHMDYDWTMFLSYHPASASRWVGGKSDDPALTDFIRRQRRELNSKAREAIFQDYVRYSVGKLYVMPYNNPATWLPYYIAHPWVGGWGWHQPYIEQYAFGGGQLHSQYWFDKSKKAS